MSIIGLAVVAIETAVKSSQTDWDDKVILPTLEKLKNALNT